MVKGCGLNKTKGAPWHCAIIWLVVHKWGSFMKGFTTINVWKHKDTNKNIIMLEISMLRSKYFSPVEKGKKYRWKNPQPKNKSVPNVGIQRQPQSKILYHN